MNRNQEAFENLEELDCLESHFLEWLKADSKSSGNKTLCVKTQTDVISSGLAQSSFDDPDLQEVEDLDPLLSESLEGLPIPEVSSNGEHPDGSRQLVSDVDRLLRLGDIPVIEERSQTILKSRLRTQIEHHPPLFPWETEIVDYEPETIDFPVGSVVPSIFGHQYSVGMDGGIGFWAPQLPKMSGLMSMPQELLTQLLEQCNRAMKSNLREWAKLVDVVEKTLFPGRFRELNAMATRLSIAQQHRSATTVEMQPMSATTAIADSIAYEVATPTQQMLMSLLAAREIIGNLTLEVSSSQPKLQRQWLTAAGLLSIEIEYHHRGSDREVCTIEVGATLPCGGWLSLTGGQSQTRSQRSNPGVLTVELSDRHLQENYLLEVHLQSSEEHSLTFALRVRK